MLNKLIEKNYQENFPARGSNSKFRFIKCRTCSHRFEWMNEILELIFRFESSQLKNKVTSSPHEGPNPKINTTILTSGGKTKKHISVIVIKR